jgi:hypothetical protein
MRFWWREVAGWALVLIGLVMFSVCFVILLANPAYPRVVEAGPLTVIGIIVFRGGIHLLKVAVAARVCLQAAAEAEARPHGGLPARREAPRPRAAVMPRSRGVTP